MPKPIENARLLPIVEDDLWDHLFGDMLALSSSPPAAPAPDGPAVEAKLPGKPKKPSRQRRTPQ